MQVSLWERDLELLRVPPARPGGNRGGLTPTPFKFQLWRQNPARQEGVGDGDLGEEPPKLAGDPSSVWRGQVANEDLGQVANEDLGQLWLDLGGFSLQVGSATCGIFWSEGGSAGKGTNTPSLCPPGCWAEGWREDGGFGVPGGEG